MFPKIHSWNWTRLMVDVLLSMPTMLGALIFITLTSVVGLLVYFLSFRWIAYGRDADQLQDVKEATGNLFRVVGWLISLFLSLTFAEVYRDLMAIENASEAEASAIMDTYDNLGRVGGEEAGQARKLLVEYTRSIIVDDWKALADDRLSSRTHELLRDIKTEILDLPTDNSKQEIVKSRVVADMDVVSDYRLLRHQKAQSSPPSVLIVVVLGYLVTMAYFGVYPPRKSLLVLVTFYTVLVGIALYLILGMSDPFEGSFFIQPVPFENVLESIQSGVFTQ